MARGSKIWHDGMVVEPKLSDPSARLLDAFCGSICSRFSPRTIAAYRRDVETLLRGSVHHPPASVTPEAIRRLLAQLRSKGLSGRSLARQLCAWRCFFDWLALDTREPFQNPCAGIRAPKSPKLLPNELSVSEAQQLLGQEIAATDSMLESRDQAMFELLYAAGLRVSEVVGLNLTDCDLVEHLVRVVGKGAKTRLVPFGRTANAAIVHWLSLRPSSHTNTLKQSESPDQEKALFTNHLGKRLGVRTVQLRLAQLGQKRGLATHVHPHRLRHSFASHLLQGSGDLRAVQELMGHSSLASTQVYTHLDFQHLSRTYDAAHPRSTRRKGPSPLALEIKNDQSTVVSRLGETKKSPHRAGISDTESRLQNLAGQANLSKAKSC